MVIKTLILHNSWRGEEPLLLFQTGALPRYTRLEVVFG